MRGLAQTCSGHSRLGAARRGTTSNMVVSGGTGGSGSGRYFLGFLGWGFRADFGDDGRWALVGTSSSSSSRNVLRPIMSVSSGSGGYHSFGTGSSISDSWESESEWSGLSGLVA